MNLNWNEQFKVRIRESTEAQVNHLIVKTLLMLAIKLKYKKNLRYQRIYSEFDLDGAIPDVYHENFQEKSVNCYEIQYQVTPEYINSKNEFYNSKEIYGIKNVNWYLIKLKEAPEDIELLWQWIKRQII